MVVRSPGVDPPNREVVEVARAHGHHVDHSPQIEFRVGIGVGGETAGLVGDLAVEYTDEEFLTHRTNQRIGKWIINERIGLLAGQRAAGLLPHVAVAPTLDARSQVSWSARVMLYLRVHPLISRRRISI